MKDKYIMYLVYAAIACIVIYILYRLWKSFSLGAGIATLEATGNVPTEIDKVNASAIKQQFGYLNDDEDAIIEIVSRYNASSYPRLKVAYYKLFEEDLTLVLKEELSETEFASLDSIVKV